MARLQLETQKAAAHNQLETAKLSQKEASEARRADTEIRKTMIAHG